VVAALRAGAPLPDARLEALHAFARAVVRERGHVGDAEVQALLDAGFASEHVLELLTQIAYTTLANLVANVAGTPVDDAFAAQRWAAAA
jgi:alkylhydroperoxidase family enzyme